MNPSKPIEIENKKPTLKKIASSALIVGTFDILAAIVLALSQGHEPVKMLRYIASGVFGEMAFSGDAIFPFAGLLFHYLIAFFWTCLFFIFYKRIRKWTKNVIMVGFVYGLFVWGAMNLVVLPLSNAFHGPLTIASTITGLLILIGMIGLPLSFIADKYYKRGKGHRKK